MANSTTTNNNQEASSSSSCQCSYRDYAHEMEDPRQMQASSQGGDGNNKLDNSGFPVKLHYMLSDMQADGLDHVVAWQPHGRCFIVHKPHVFADKILPLWFRQSKYSSFQRQLNLYGFKRITTGPDKGAHYHELFLRSKRHLAFRIRRVKIKGQGARKPANPKEEPDFYSKPFLPPEELPPTSAKAMAAKALLPNHKQNAADPAVTHAYVSTMLQQLQQPPQQLVQPLLVPNAAAFGGLTPHMLSYLMGAAAGLAPLPMAPPPPPPHHPALLQLHSPHPMAAYPNNATTAAALAPASTNNNNNTSTVATTTSDDKSSSEKQG